jgi:hypothetical protein
VQAQSVSPIDQPLVLSTESANASGNPATSSDSRPPSAKRAKSRLPFLLFTVVGVAVAAGIFWFVFQGFFNSTENRNKAAIATTPTLSVLPAATSVNVNGDVNVTVNLDTAARQIAVAEVTVKYDPAYLQVISAGQADFLPSVLSPINLTSTPGQISTVLAKPYSVPPTAATGTGRLLNVRFKAVKAGTTSISFVQNLSRAPQFGGLPANIIAAYAPSTVTITGGQTPPVNSGERSCKSATAANGTTNKPLAINCTVSTSAAADVRMRVLKGTTVVTATPLNKAVAAGANQAVAFSYTPTSAGAYTAQCQVCKSAAADSECTDWGYTEPIFDSAACKWCAGQCVANDAQHELCAAVNPQDPGYYCALAGTACQNVASTQQCVASFAVADPVQPGTATGKQTIEMQFKVQGIKKSGISIPVEVGVRYAEPSTGAVQKTYGTVTALSGTDGVLKATYVFSTAPKVTKDNLVDVFVKSPVSLRRKIGTVTLAANQSTTKDQLYGVDGTAITLPVGDFIRTGAENNVIRITDITKIFSGLTSVRVPITAANKELDLNYDNYLTILDVTTAFSNLTSARVTGDEL